MAAWRRPSIFHEGWDLPIGEAFILLDSDRGRDALRAYFDRYVPMALAARAGFILESATWRASPDWGRKARLRARGAGPGGNRRAGVRLLHELQARAGRPPDRRDADQRLRRPARRRLQTRQSDERGGGGPGLPRAGQIGVLRQFRRRPRHRHHDDQRGGEAVGVVRAARARGLPVVISFTVETDGRLPTGERLGEAVRGRRRGNRGRSRLLHDQLCPPRRISPTTSRAARAWLARIRGLRANASRCSHAELDGRHGVRRRRSGRAGPGSTRDLCRRFPHITVLGGCCGTDHRHVACISEALPRVAA